MTISSIPATTVQSLATATSATQSNSGTAGTMGTMGTIGSQLLAAVTQMEAAGNASSPLLQEIVSLSGNSPGTQTAPLTYNAQGLIGHSDPLLQSSASGASTSIAGSSASLAQALQSDPAMAATVVQSQIDQGVLSMLS